MAFRRARPVRGCSFPHTTFTAPRDPAGSPVFQLDALSTLVRSVLLAIAAGATTAIAATPTTAAPAERSVQARSYSIPAGALPDVLTRFAAEAGIMLSFDPSALATQRSPGLQGNYSVQEGFDRLLEGSGFERVDKGDGAWSLRPLPNARRETLLAPVKVVHEGENAYGPVRGYIARRSATATKTDTPTIETPQSISVITSERIEAIGATRLKEALAYTPGIVNSPWGDESQYDWIYIRGFDAYSPGFYLDGLQLRNSGSWGVWQTENYGTERIDILRGPSSVLYGQNGPGGIINVVSKRPTAAPLRELEVQLGEYSRKQIGGDFSGALDDEGTLLYRVTALARDAELSTADLPDDRLFIAPALTWQPSDKTTLTVLSQFLRMRTGSVWSSYPAIGTLLPNPNGKIENSTFIGESDFNRYDQDQWMVGYLLDHQLDDTWTLRQNARYGRFDVDYKTFYNQQYVTVNELDPTDPANFRLMERTPFASDERARAIIVDNQAQARLEFGDWQHTLLFGFDYQRTLMDVVAHYGGFAPPIDVYDPRETGGVVLNDPFIDSKLTLLQNGLYVQDQIKFDERWVFTLGGRYDRATVDTDDHLSASSSKNTDEQFSGRAGVVYLAGGGWAPYVSYSESFSPTTTIDPATGAPFSPETGKQYEAGIRYQPEERNETYSAAIFNSWRRNYVTYGVDYIPRQTGEVEVRGLELEALLQPTPQLNITAAYTYTPKADVTASSNPAEVGRQLMSVPEQQLSLWGDYRFDVGLKFGIGMRYTGSTHGANESAPKQIPDYVLLDALLGYDFDAWSLALNARNLTDKTYVATCDGSGMSCSYGEGRKVVATATYRW